MTTVQYLSADEWGMTWVRPPVAEKLHDEEVYVHHTGGGQLSPDAAEAFRRLNHFAQVSKGYSALDYDVLVHYDPDSDVLTIGEGRGRWMSAATKDRNEQGEAVCVLGYFHPGHQLSRRPYPAEVEGVALAIVYGVEHGWISRGAKILGHRDNPAHPGATGCPGDYLQAELLTIRRRVAELLLPPAPEPPSVGGEAVSEYFTLEPTIPTPLFERQGDFVRWINPTIYNALGAPGPQRVVSDAEAQRLTLVGPKPVGWDHVINKFGGVA